MKEVLVNIGIMLAWFLGIVTFVLVLVMYLTYLERKIIGFIQVRLGPMRVGKWGLLQPVADAIKLFQKEDIIPIEADALVFAMAPIVVFMPVLLSMVAIPFGTWINGKPLIVSDLNIGLLYILAVSSVGVVGIVMGGWASNNKYSLFGALRSAAQEISYEVPLVTALLGTVMITGSLSLVTIVEYQRGVWLILPQFIAFLLYFACALAETNRSPFDIPEAESELVGGFHTEYSGMKFALFFLAEYANMFLVSAIATVVFFGGWLGPFVGSFPILGLFYLIIKSLILVLVMVWLRGTLPRFRVDQLMEFAWKVMLPLTLANVFFVGLGIAMGHPWFRGAMFFSRGVLPPGVVAERADIGTVLLINNVIWVYIPLAIMLFVFGFVIYKLLSFPKKSRILSDKYARAGEAVV